MKSFLRVDSGRVMDLRGKERGEKGGREFCHSSYELIRIGFLIHGRLCFYQLESAKERAHLSLYIRIFICLFFSIYSSFLLLFLQSLFFPSVLTIFSLPTLPLQELFINNASRGGWHNGLWKQQHKRNLKQTPVATEWTAFDVRMNHKSCAASLVLTWRKKEWGLCTWEY